MAGAGMDRRRKYDFMDEATANAAAAAAIPAVLGGEVVDLGPEKPRRAPVDSGKRIAAAQTSLASLIEEAQARGVGTEAKQRPVRVFAEILPESVANVGELRIAEDGVLDYTSAVALGDGKRVQLLQERQRFGEPLGTLDVKASCSRFDFDQVLSLLLPTQESSSSSHKAVAISYGATGSGKTFCQQRLQRAVGAQMLSAATAGNAALVLSVVEVLENCRDLLAPVDTDSSLPLRQGSNEQLMKCSEHEIRSESELENLLSAAHEARRSQATEQSPASSRTHCICKFRSSRGPEITLVDLAGSERAADRQKHSPQLLSEAKAINWSLACLHECVRHVAEGAAHVPVRQTPVTRLLEDTLTAKSGNTRVVWIAHLHPSSRQVAHSLHTLSIATDVIKASVAQERRSRPWHQVPPKSWTKSQLASWIAETFPSIPSDAFSWADGATFAREWERDLVARAELAGAAATDASAAYEAFHARCQSNGKPTNVKSGSVQAVISDSQS